MADTSKPIAPVVTASARIVLKWSGARDNIAIARYEAWDGTTFLKALASTTRQYTTPPLSPGRHKLRIVAYDAAGNYANSAPYEAVINVVA
jgi:hypothetical protein